MKGLSVVFKDGKPQIQFFEDEKDYFRPPERSKLLRSIQVAFNRHVKASRKTSRQVAQANADATILKEAGHANSNV